MSVYLISGGKIKDREARTNEMVSEFWDGNFETSIDKKIIDIEEGKKNISIDQVRTIEDFSLSKPIERKSKIVIVKNAGKLSVEAQNAILKTLEDPPFYLKFILETERTKSLLPTIISRCILVEIGSGEFIDVETADNSNYIDTFVNLVKSDLGRRFDWAVKNKELLKEDKLLVSYLDSWEIFVRDVLVSRYLDTSFLKNKYKLSEVSDISGVLKESCDLDMILRRILLAKSAAKSNVSKSLVIENFLISLPDSNV